MNSFSMKVGFFLSAIIFSNKVISQTHHVFPAESSMQDYGRVIDVIEVEPSVVALQTFQFGNDYSFKQADLCLYNLNSMSLSKKTTLSTFDSYRGGFGVLSDKSLVLNTINSDNKYELKNFIYQKSTFELDAKASLEGSFAGVPGGIAPLKGGGYVMLAALLNKETNMFCNQVFRKNTGSVFGMEGTKSEGYEHSILMKPHFLQGMHSHFTPIKYPNLMIIGQQVAVNESGKSISLVVHTDESEKNPFKITGYSKELTEEWSLEFDDLRFGFKPIAYGKDNTWFLTTFSEGTTKTTETKIQKYAGKTATALTKVITDFEANGSFMLASGDLCVYGFKTTIEKEILPMFYVLNAQTLETKKSWVLSSEDKPCKDISEIAGQTIVLPGKFYSASQLSDGSVVFGGHLISNVIVFDGETNRNLTFNYVLQVPATFFK